MDEPSTSLHDAVPTVLSHQPRNLYQGRTPRSDHTIPDTLCQIDQATSNIDMAMSDAGFLHGFSEVVFDRSLNSSTKSVNLKIVRLNASELQRHEVEAIRWQAKATGRDGGTRLPCRVKKGQGRTATGYLDVSDS